MLNLGIANGAKVCLKLRLPSLFGDVNGRCRGKDVEGASERPSMKGISKNPEPGVSNTSYA